MERANHSVDLKQKLSEGQLKLVTQKSSKSNVWKIFFLVVDATSTEPSGFVQCSVCNDFFTYHGGNTGTSQLNRHKCKPAVQPVTSVANFFKVSSPNVSSTFKDEVTKACVEMCAKDARPFDTVSGDGFLKVAQTFIKAGSLFGNIDAKVLLPHPRTVSRQVSEFAETVRAFMKPEIESAIKHCCCGATTDMWTEDYKKMPYITMTVHYFDENWELKSKVSFTCDPDERKTGGNIRNNLQRGFTDFGNDVGLLNNIKLVTGQGTNIVSAL